MNILHIDSSILGEHSVSRFLSAEMTKKISQRSSVQVTYRDIVSTPVPHLTAASLGLAGGNVPSGMESEAQLAQDILQEFLKSDVVVIGVGFYNFGIPSQLKSWIDRICVAGTTFRYTPQGPEGLMKGKKVILAVARGGVYSHGSSAAFEHAESHLRSIFAFLGVTDIQTVIAEGVALGEESKAQALRIAQESIEKIGESFL